MESDSVKERVRGTRGNLWTGLCQRGQQGWRRHLGGAAPLQTGVSQQKHQGNKTNKPLGISVGEGGLMKAHTGACMLGKG